MNRVTILRLDETFSDWDGLLSLIWQSFASMHGRIDPPSSATALTGEALQRRAGNEIGFLAVEDRKLAGCIFCRPESQSLYIGKLAVLPGLQGKGIGRQLLAAAEAVALRRNLAVLRLETRIELAENHATFAAWGFVKTAENTHSGFTRTTSIEMQKRLAP